MECQASLVFGYLLLPDLDPEEVRRGQLLTLATGLSLLLVLQFTAMLAQTVMASS